MLVLNLVLSFSVHEYWGLSKKKKGKKARPQTKVTSEFFKKYIPSCLYVIYFLYFLLLRDLDHYAY